jgi:hypothetical protein
MKLNIIHFSLISTILIMNCGRNPYPEVVTFYSQSSKCLLNGLSKSADLDSVFTYLFDNNLLIDFSVTANCCPDSNRFSISQITGTDTIIISVADTAQNLCKCVCPYMIHVEFENLSKDHYVVRCRQSNSQGCLDPIYLADVYRNNKAP